MSDNWEVRHGTRAGDTVAGGTARRLPARCLHPERLPVGIRPGGRTVPRLPLRHGARLALGLRVGPDIESERDRERRSRAALAEPLHNHALRRCPGVPGAARALRAG